MAKMTNSVPPTSNILMPLPALGADESVGTLLKGNGFRLERIVSHGQASPAGFWYDQDDAEWVLVVTGKARLTIEGEGADRELLPGDSVFLPAHCRHRVAWTRPDQPTVWLTIFIDQRLSPKPGGA
jgi:cupin 2 domain-containing protein